MSSASPTFPRATSRIVSKQGVSSRTNRSVMPARNVRKTREVSMTICRWRPFLLTEGGARNGENGREVVGSTFSGNEMCAQPCRRHATRTGEPVLSYQIVVCFELLFTCPNQGGDEISVSMDIVLALPFKLSTHFPSPFYC